MSYYQRIRDLREDKELTQDDVCDMLKIHKSKYERYEQGKSKIDFDFIVQIAKLYDVSIDYIAGLTNSKKKEW